MKTVHGLVAPTVNMNGTSLNQLVQANVKTIEALQKAALALRFSMPHGRDYQTTEPNELDDAVKQHGRWMKSIEIIVKELTEVTSEIVKQGNRKDYSWMQGVMDDE